MKTPTTIKELRKALTGWHISHGRMGGFENLYSVSLRKSSETKWKSYRRYNKKQAIAAAYAAALAVEKDV